MENKIIISSEIFVLIWFIVIILKGMGYIAIPWWIVLLPIFSFFTLTTVVALFWLMGFMIVTLYLIYKYINEN